jgi:DNA anti-recombination protein RmuC
LAPDLKNWDSLQADATRKTMAAAEIRKEFEARAQSFAEEQQLSEALFTERAQLENVKSRLNQFNNVNWQQWQAENPQAAQAASMELLQLQRAERELTSNIEGRRADLTARQQQAIAKLNSQAVEALSKPDPVMGWDGKFDADKSQKLTSFLEKVGFTPAEIKGTNHPLMIKVAYAAMKATEALAKKRTAAAPPKPAAEPVTQITPGKTRSVFDPNKASQAEFNRWREAQTKKARA